MVDIKGSQIPISDNTQPGDMLMGIRRSAGGNLNFNLSVTALLNATNGAFMGSAEAETNPGVPTSARYYQGKPGVTYTYFKNSANQSIVIPKEVNGQYVVDVRLIWNGSSWSATWGLMDVPDNKTKEWAAGPYLAGDQVFYNGTIYEANANTGASDVPGTSIKWKETIDLTAVKTDAKGALSLINGTTQTGTAIVAQFEFSSSALIQGRTIEYKVTNATAGDQITVFLIREDGSAFSIGNIGTDGVAKTYILLENFTKLRFYNNTAQRGYQAHFTLKGSLADISSLKFSSDTFASFFYSSSQVSIPVTWLNEGAYWNTSGVKSANASYDVSAPIATNGFKYFGYYGRLNEGNMAIVSVNADNQPVKVLEVGRLTSANNGMSLIIFKASDAAYISLSALNSLKSTSLFFQLKAPFLIRILDDIEANKNAVSDLATSILSDVTVSGTPTGTMRQLDLASPLLTKGRTIEYKVSDYTSGSSIATFLFRADGTYVSPSPAQASNVANRYTLTEDFVRIRYYNNSNGDGFKGYLTVLSPLNAGKVTETPLRTLILGDSYSQTSPTNGTLSAWVSVYKNALPEGSTVISLAVSSASVKDKSNDRAAFPYTDRPVSSNSTGNLNTLACQIQKLKRLMAGTDLDAGETKLYPTSDTYPHVIILEGGMNDSPDSDAVAATYISQFTKQFTNVYIKRSADATAALGSVYGKTPMAEVNRTCFAGAYRYALDELSVLFPNAQIFIVTASRLGYWTTDVNTNRSKTAAQQRVCAELAAASVIDWNAEGQINTIVNYPQGTGTELDPYIWDRTVGNVDTNDAMHPNTRGGNKYGRLAAKVVKERFLSIS